MNIFIEAFNLVLYQPIFNALILIYQLIGDFGLAVIILTLIVRIILAPLSWKAAESQKGMMELQPKLQKIREKYKKDMQAQGKATKELFDQHKVSPAAGCLPILLQFPVLIALYLAFWRGLEPAQLDFLYSFVARPENVMPTLLGIMDLAAPSWVLAVIAGALQYWQAKMFQPKMIPQKDAKGDFQATFQNVFQKQMVYLFPIFTFIILLQFPAALGIYWALTNAFTIFQQYLILQKRKRDEENPQNPPAGGGGKEIPQAV